MHLRECGITIPVKDIDINIITKATGETILNRWLSIVPPSYTAKYDVNYPITIFTLTDTTGKDLPIDIFVNEQYIFNTEQIGPFRVQKLDNMITSYYQELLGRKTDIELIRNGTINWNPEELPILIDKYNRMFERLKLLAEC